MGVLLEIMAGPMAGKVIGLKTGETVTFGRAAGRAQFALPHDTFMSGVHFAVECGPSGCRVRDHKSSNGTFLNGARIQDAMLANGDEIKSGQTIFAVKMVADAKLASMASPQDPALTSTSARRRRAMPPAPRADAPPESEALEPVPPSAAEQRLRAAQPVSPAVPSAAQAEEERKLASFKFVPEPAVDNIPASPSSPMGRPVVESPSPAMRTADLGEESAERQSPQDAAAEPPARKFEPAVEPAARKLDPPEPAAAKFLGALDPQQVPASGSEPRVEAPAKNALPQLEEPPHLRAIPSPPVVGGQLQRAGENPGVEVKTPQSVQLRGGEPPVGAAPAVAQRPVAQKNIERPAARGGGSSRSFAFSVMGWSFPAAPAEWLVQEGFGLQQSGHDEFPSSVAATEELLGGITLQQFVESQISMLRGYLRDPKIEPTMPPRVGGADESMAMDVRHSTKDGRELVYRRIYARSGSSVGVLTVTTLAADLPQVLQSLQPLLDGAAFRSTANN